MRIKLQDEKKWNILTTDNDISGVISQKFDIPELVAKLLVTRGFDTQSKVQDFLSADDYSFIDPFLLKDMDKAVNRVNKAITGRERILIYGDYDVDGITSVATLYLYLREQGANVCYYIPERLSEGYGLNTAAIDKFAAAGIQLIITVDTGVTASAETEYAKEKQIDVVITDHHECREELPEAAYAVVNPQRSDNEFSFRELAGVGVVFKLICALEGEENLPAVCDKYIDLVSVGTLADVMPLVGENRRIVCHGLKCIKNTKNLGIRTLIKAACPEYLEKNKKIPSSLVSFALAPRLNAAGRIGDVKNAAELLITQTAEIAESLADILCTLNKQRQNIENEILLDAEKQISENINLEKTKVIVLSSEKWHQGVTGIVASRITEKYRLPSVLITFKDGIGKGSARSIKGFNINEAFSNCKEYLLKYGGHELAAGLSLSQESLEDFNDAINYYAQDILNDEMRQSCINIDCELSADEIDIETASALSLLEPFGLGNAAPVFVLKDARVDSVVPIGANKHLKLVLSKDGKKFSAVYFNMSPENFRFLEGFTVDVAFNLEINEYKGSRNAQLNVRDIKLSERILTYINKQAKEYLVAISSFIISKDNLPDMQNFKAVFIYLRAKLKDTKYVDVYKTARSVSDEFSMNVTPCMLNIILDVFYEMGLIELERSGLNDCDVVIKNVENKVVLENSRLLRSLRGLH